MIGKFNDNKLSKLSVINSAESIFFVRNEDEELIGMNKTSSDKIEIRLKDNKINTIKLLTGTNSMIQPIEKTNESQRKLKGYNNLESIRPKSPLDIF
jgi:ASC-1-like (ASCH) protein